VREPLKKVHEGILRLLDSITISDISRDDLEVPADTCRPRPAGLLQLEPGAAAVQAADTR
jgi:hypothetical protein